MAEPEPGGRRYLVATGVTTGLERSAGQIVESVSAMADLLVGEFGYRRVPGLGIDPAKAEMEKRLRSFCLDCSPEDLLVVYHTGHGDQLEVGQRHRLWMGDTTDRLTGTIATADLVELAFFETPLRHLLLIIDTCFAGQGGGQALLSGMQAMGRSADRTLTVLTAAHPREQIVAGDFARLFAEAVRHPATAGHEPRYLIPNELAEYMKSSPNRKQWQTIACSTLFGSVESQRFFVNPRHDTRLQGHDVLTQIMMREQTMRDEDLRTHFLPRARGVDVPAEVAWRFVGRHTALRELVRWLGDAGPGAVRVVTGDPGSGKSAVLGRLVVLSDPGWRAAVPLHDVPGDTVPAAGSIDAAVHARGRTAPQILAGLAAAAKVDATTPGELLLAIRGTGLLAVVDAVDEAVDPDYVVSWLLQPLIRGAGAAGLRLLLGTRKHLVDRIGATDQVLDLDAPEYIDQPSLRRYTSRCLRESAANSPFRDAADDVVHPVAAAVAAAAGRSFLVALIVSRTLAAGSSIPDASDPSWAAGLPGTAAEAMHNDLEARLGADAERARELLRPLAYARGAGLPWAGIWAPLAAALSGHAYLDEDIVWLMRNAGAYVIEALEAGGSVYRLYHLSLAEYLRWDKTESKVHDAYVTFLEGRAPELTPGHRDWTRAPTYALGHLASHAEAAGRFGRFVNDGLYLAVASPAAVIAALGSLTNADELSAATAYQRSLHLLRNAPLTQRMSYLELWAQRVRAHSLVTHIRESPIPRLWITEWTHWPFEFPHRVLPGVRASVRSVTVLSAKPPMVAAVGKDMRLFVWDLNTTELLANPRLGSADLISVREAATPHGPGVVAVLDANLRLHRLEVGTWTPQGVIATVGLIRRALSRLSSPEPVLMCGTLPDGRPVAFVGGKGCPATVWDLHSGQPVHRLAEVSTAWLPVSFAESSDRRPLILLRRSDVLQYWDLVTGTPLPRTNRRRRHDQTSYYCDLEGRPVAAITIGENVTCWDLITNAPFHSQSLSGDRKVRTEARARAIAQAQDIIARRYPGTELLDAAVGDEGALSIERTAWDPAEGGRLSGFFVNDRQAIRLTSLADGSATNVLLTGHTSAIAEAAAAFIDDRTVVLTVSHDGSVRLWDLDAIARMPSRSSHGWSAPVYHLTSGVLPDGRPVVLSHDAAGIGLWDAEYGRERERLQGPAAATTAAASIALVDDASGGLSAIAFSADGRAYTWDATSGAPGSVFRVHPISWVARASGLRRADGTVEMVTVGHGRRALGWQAPGWSLRKLLRGHAGWTASVDCGWDDRGRPIAVTGGTDGRVCLWDLIKFRRRRRLRSIRRWRFIRSPEAMRVSAVRLLSGPFPIPVAALLMEDQGLRIIDLRTGRFLGPAVDGGELLTTSTLANGRVVAVTAMKSGQVKVLSVSVKRSQRIAVRFDLLTSFDLEVPLSAVELRPDGLLYVGTAHGLSCLRLALSPDGRPG